jgi:hypothetical protein
LFVKGDALTPRDFKKIAMKKIIAITAMDNPITIGNAIN